MPETASVTPLENLRNARLDKIAALRQLGLDPYPSQSRRTHYSNPILTQYEEHEGKPVTVAGRLISWRKQGGMAFGHIQDQTGQIQLVLRRQTLAPTDPATNMLGYADLNLLDVGDFVEADGVVGKTQRGEMSVMASSFRILAKSLRPLPDKWSGIKDRELILRKRYLEAVANPESRARFEGISRMLFATREFLYDRGFLEFQTPIIQPQYGGGTAKPFRTQVNALGVQMYLSISHELYLKRLIAAGFDKVFTIGRYFRNEGIDRSHHPEFSMVETMTAYENYEYNMELVESMFRHIAVKAFGRTTFTVGGHSIDFAPAWERISMADAVERATGVDFRTIATTEEANEHLVRLGAEPAATIGHGLVNAFEKLVAPHLIQPALVYGHPVEISPLAKPMRQDPRYVERFEIFIAGMECGDNWSEQNDPVQLYERWKQMYRTDSTEGEFQPIDYDFLEVLEHGMPPTTGIGPGIERMAMIFTEQADIYDVIFFPMMKPVLSESNKAIYGDTAQHILPQPSHMEAEDLVVTLEDFENLVRDCRLQPASEEIGLSASVSVFPLDSLHDRAAARGHLVIEGLLERGRIVIAAYQAVSEHNLDRAGEMRKVRDLADRSLKPVLERLFPGFRFVWRAKIDA